MDWKRPDNIFFPTVWATFEGKERGGIKNQYWIQDLTSDYHEEVLRHMSTKFIKESPICIYTNFSEDQQSIDDYVEVWKKMFELRLSLICLTKDANNQKAKLVGCNILGRRYKGEKRNVDEIFKGKASRISGKALYHVYQNCKDIFTELDIEEYVSAFGLYVSPEYRGDGIGYQLLKARGEICVGVGMGVSVTAFTTISGQKLAEKVGFQDLLEIAYEDLQKMDPLFEFPGIEKGETKTIKLMYKKYK